MKSREVQNVVVDEANEVTYEVTAPRCLNDGELYSAIRVALLKQLKLGRIRLHKGETQKVKTSRLE